jgi:hypothetical protein
VDTSFIRQHAHTLHREGLALVKEGGNGSALRKLKDKKKALLIVDPLISIVYQAGEALEEYIQKIQTHSEVRCLCLLF